MRVYVRTYVPLISRTGNERCSAFVERVFCSDVLFGCSLNAVRRSVNGVRCSAMLSSVFCSAPICWPLFCSEFCSSRAGALSFVRCFVRQSAFCSATYVMLFSLFGQTCLFDALFVHVCRGRRASNTASRPSGLRRGVAAVGPPTRSPQPRRFQSRMKRSALQC